MAAGIGQQKPTGQDTSELSGGTGKHTQMSTLRDALSANHKTTGETSVTNQPTAQLPTYLEVWARYETGPTGARWE